MGQNAYFLDKLGLVNLTKALCLAVIFLAAAVCLLQGPAYGQDTLPSAVVETAGSAVSTAQTPPTEAEARAQVLLHGLLLGLLLGFAAYQLTRHVNFSAEFAFPTFVLLSTAFLFEYIYFGYHESFFTKGGNSWLTVRAMAFAALTGAGLYFFRNVLALSENAKPLSWIVLAALGTMIFCFIYALFNPEIAMSIAQLALVGGVFLGTVAAILLRSRAIHGARIVLVGMFFFVPAIILVLVEQNAPGTIPNYSEHAVQSLVVIGLILLSFAVSNERDAAHAAIRQPASLALPPPQPALIKKTVVTSEEAEGPTYSAGGRVRYGVPEKRLSLALSAAQEGLWDWNIEDRTIYISDEIKQLLKIDDDKFDGSEESWIEIIHEDDREMFRSRMVEHVERCQPNFEMTFRCHPPLTSDPVWVNLRAGCKGEENGIASRCIGLLSDVSAQKQQEIRLRDTERTLKQKLGRDQLTGMLDRRGFLNEFERLIKDGDTDKTLMVFDLDRFQTVNEGLGHDAGDEVICSVARRLEAAASKDDMLARLGGDEFAILLNEKQDTNDADQTAEIMLEAIAKPIELESGEVFVAASAGLADATERHRSAAEVLNDAEVAMYQAKRSGGGQHQVYSPAMRGHDGHTASLETDLHRALERDELELHYQPIMALKDGRIAGFEALLRWRHPHRGIVPAEQFIRLAEDTGLIVSFGKFALAMASVQLYQWQTFFPLNESLFVSVNLSSRELLRKDLIKDVKEVMTAVSLAPKTLKIELTESQVMQDQEMAAEVISNLHDIGAGLALDDFGTGYSSLSHLKEFAFDTLKVDRSFMSEAPSDDGDAVITKSIVDLAHDLKLDVVAEGIESQQDVDRLKEMGCEFGQGFFFGAPMMAGEAQTFIARHWSN